ALPFRNERVDVVSLINVLDHTPNPLAILREVHRVLSPGGYLVLRIPNAAFHRPCVRLLASLGPLARLRGWDGYPILHLFAFTPLGLQSMVNRAGFRVLEIRNSFPAAEGRCAAQKQRRAVGLQWARRGIVAAAASVKFLSREKWLVGPSIELYGQRLSSSSTGET
ncbi:MAG TPA: methyltransferase domain-containing protein, partial [Candidatus Methylomirabilis sp.]|nr:methyltransferase domain-containing protein [Candidatus Methylomirabilis sp.]